MCRYIIIPQIYSDCAALQPHVITVKHVIQCRAVNFSSKMRNLPLYRRICENQVFIGKDAEGDEDIEKEDGVCPLCFGAAILEASDSDATVYFVHAYRGISMGYSLGADSFDLDAGLDTSKRPVHQGPVTGAQQKVLAESNKPGQSSPDGPVQFPEHRIAPFWRDPTGPLPTSKQLERAFGRKNAPSTVSSSNTASTVFSKQSHQSVVTHGTSISDHNAQQRLPATGNIELESVPETREPVSEENDKNEKMIKIAFYNSLNPFAITKHMENSWIEAEVDGEVFYVNPFYKGKTQWEKPSNAFIKVLPQTEKIQEGSRRQMGRVKYTDQFRKGELRRKIREQRTRVGGDRNDRGEDRYGDLSSGPPTSHQMENTQNKPNQVMIPGSEEKITLRILPDLSQSETIGGTNLYEAVHREFMKIIVGVSNPSDDDYRTLEPILSLKPWMESHSTRLKIWSQDVGVEEDALYSLLDHQVHALNSDLHESLTEYLISVYEALKIIDQNICEGLQNLALVGKHSAIHQFVLKTTRESIVSNLEEIDALLDKLFLLVDPINICLALKDKTGPYAEIIDAVGKIELDPEGLADMHEDMTLHSTSGENSSF